MLKANLLITSLLAISSGCLSPPDELDVELDDDLETSQIESAATVYNWSDDQQISGQRSAYQVGLAQLGNRVHMMYTTDYGYLYSARFDGTYWTSASQINVTARADYGPALVNHGGQLRLVYRSRGENRLMMATSGTGTTWTAPVTAGSTLGGATILNAPAAMSHGTSFYIGYCTRTSAGDMVRIDRLDGAAWTKVAELSAVHRCQNVTLASHSDGRFDILANVEKYDGSWYMYEWTGFGTPNSFLQRRALSMKSKKPMSVVTCAGNTHLVHGGYSTPREIWWTVRENGQWLGDTRIPNQASEGGSSLACLGTQTIMVHNGGYPDLWWARYVE